MAAAALIGAVAIAAASAASAGAVDAGCRPIAYHLVFDRGPREAAQILRSVFDEMETLTGLRFVPANTRGDGDVPVRIAWVRDPDAGPWNAGELGQTTVAWDHRDRWATIRAGQILFRSAAEAERIEAGPVDWHTLARHEIGHLLGLPHWPDPRSVMHPTLTPHPQTWTKQQHALLTAAGRNAGCHPPRWQKN